MSRSRIFRLIEPFGYTIGALFALLLLVFLFPAEPAHAELNPSGKPAVNSIISSAAQSAAFTPIAGRTFHVKLSGTAVATCQLVRNVDGTGFVPYTAGGIAAYNLVYSGTPMSEDVSDDQSGVIYAADCGAVYGSYTSGTLIVSFTQ